MEAGMGATAKFRDTTGNNIRGIASTAFIDVNYEAPMNKVPQPSYQQQQQQQQYRQFPPKNGFNMPPQRSPYMNPQMNMSMNNQQQYGMYMNPDPSGSMVSVPQSMNMNMNMNMNNSKSHSLKSRTRRNSNASMSTISVNKFMKKQWNRLGGGSSIDVSSPAAVVGRYDGDADGDGDGKTELDAADNEITFDDLQHIRGSKLGFGLTDSTPYIPTVKTKINSGTSSNNQYRKVQMAQKKAMARNFAKQNKQPQQQMPPLQPRSMSLQGYGPGPVNPTWGPPLPNQSPNAYMQYPPPNGMMMGPPPNGMMMPPYNNPNNRRMMSLTMNNPNNSNPQFNPRSMSLQSDSALRQRNFQQHNNNSNPMLMNNKNRSTSSNIMSTTTPTSATSYSNNNSKISLNISDNSNNTINDLNNLNSKQLKLDTANVDKKVKNVNRIDFSPITADDEDDNDNGFAELDAVVEQLHDIEEESIEPAESITKLRSLDPAKQNQIEVTPKSTANDESPVKQDVLPTLPTEEESTTIETKRKSKQHQVNRSVADSVVSFGSFNQKDQKSKQEKLYHLKNNSSQKTIFYSATEFPLSSPEKGDNDSKIHLATHAEEKEEQEQEDKDEGEETITANNTNNTSKHTDMNEISESLDQLVLKSSPVVNQNSFANNYGSYGINTYSTYGTYGTDSDPVASRESTHSEKSNNTTEPLHLKVSKTDKSPISSPKEESFDKKTTVTCNDISPAKSEVSKNLVDMTLSLTSLSKESSPLRSSIKRTDLLSKPTESSFAKEFSPPPSAANGVINDSLTAATSVKSTPSKIRSLDNIEPKTPVSESSSNGLTFFTPEQYGLLNDNTQLLHELELVTNELASSVSREITLEDTLRKTASGNDVPTLKNQTTLSDENNNRIMSEMYMKDLTVKENGDVEIGSNIKTPTQYASIISSLTKQLNEERKRRYLVEEMLLKFQNSTTGDIQTELLEKNTMISDLQNELSNIRESVKLHESEKDLLNIENSSLKLEIQELQRKNDNLESEVVPRLRNQVDMLDTFINNSNLQGSN